MFCLVLNRSIYFSHTRFYHALMFVFIFSYGGSHVLSLKSKVKVLRRCNQQKRFLNNTIFNRVFIVLAIG